HARPQHPPYGQQAPQGPSYGYPQAPQPPYPQQPSYGSAGGGGGSPWPDPHAGRRGHPGAPGGGYGGHGEPEYFGDGHPQGHGPQGGYDPYAANNPGHTQAFAIGDAPSTQGGTYQARSEERRVGKEGSSRC